MSLTEAGLDDSATTTAGVNEEDLVRLGRAVELAEAMANDSSRSEIPVRRLFVRAETPGEVPPLARLVSTRGRGGDVAIKLFLALLWRCSSGEFDTEIPAGRWAELLALPSPRTLGARRVTAALSSLQDAELIKVTPRAGDSSVITLLNESGNGASYSLPSTASAQARSKIAKQRNLYFKVPLDLWTEGLIQTMSGPAVAMLLVLLDSRNRDGSRTWWSTEYFPAKFALSPAVRTKGTRELADKQLVRVVKQLVDPSKGRSFGRDRVRQTYELLGPARPIEMVQAQQDEMAQQLARFRDQVGMGTRQ